MAAAEQDDEGPTPEALEPMLDPTWTEAKGYAHALALIAVLEARKELS